MRRAPRRTEGESLATKYSERRTATPYIFVADSRRAYSQSQACGHSLRRCTAYCSRRAARLTLGDRYEQSILMLVPTAPSMAHPKCRPYPIFVL